MKTVERSALVAYTNQQMYELVADVPGYKEFLPWCSNSHEIRESPDTVLATVEIAIAGVRKSFTTRNTNQPYHRIDLTLEDGPFDTLHGNWQFEPRGESGSEVLLILTYNFASGLLAAAVAPVFDRIANSMVDAFVERATELY